MFNLAIDSKLRGCDVVAIKVEDVAASGYTADRATVRQKKTGRPVGFELSEQTRQAVDDYLKAANKRPGEFLFTGRRGTDRSMTTRQYARLVSGWTTISWIPRSPFWTKCGGRLRSSRRCGLGIPSYSDRAVYRPSHTVHTVIGAEAAPRECRRARRLTAASIGPGPTA
jgi:hypothetical protein